MSVYCRNIQRRVSPAFFRTRLTAFLLACALCLCGGAPQGSAAGRYGTPLQFDPPPVDLEYGSGSGAASSAAEEGAGAVKPASPSRRAPAKPAGAGEEAKAPGAEEETGDEAQEREQAGASAQKPQGPAAKPIRLFGTVEFRSPIKNLPKWERVRGAEKKKSSFGGNKFDVQNKKVAERWAGLKAKLVDAPLMEQVRQVNKFFNQWPYKTDLDIWGVEDYWATPREFVQKSGDCEDYAIAKYYALRDLGVPASSLRVAAVKDTIRNLGHAVLIVFVENDAYLLDNLTNLVLSHSKLKHYAPYYTVNEDYLWRHVKPKSVPARR